MSTYNKEHQDYLKKIKKEKIIITIIQLSIIIVFITIWQLLVSFEIINSFLSSSPIEVVDTIITLIKSNNLFNHISVTIIETIVSFLLATFIGVLVATILWWYKYVAKVVEPYLTVINSIPKVALGPLIIIWVGASTSSIIFMALMISVFISIINIYNGFTNTNQNYIKLMKSFEATKRQIYTNVIIPSNIKIIINSMKVNISMSLVGVIMGELLVSKEGLGYLIIYGSQVFNIDLVITAIIILAIVSWIMYFLISLLEKKLSR